VKWLAKPYQKQAIQHGLNCFKADGACALLLDPGLGKTSISLAIFTVLKARGAVQTLLVLAPRRAMLHTWPTEIAKWDQFKHLRVSLMHGNPQERLAGLNASADVYLMHYDNLHWLALALQGREAPFDVLVLDESTKVKNPSTRRFKSLFHMLPRFKMRVALSGTPTPLHIGDLFGQIYACDMGARLGSGITKFRTEYMNPKWIPGVPVPNWEPQRDAEARIFDKLDGMALRLSSKDHLQMPELIRNTITVDMPPEAFRQYRTLKRDLVVDIEGGKVTAANAAAGSMKLRQMASGIVYMQDGYAQIIHEAKIEALLDLLEEQQGQPLLVATGFRSEVEHLQRVLRTAGYGTVPALVGGITDAYADRVILAWNTGRLPVLVCHPTTVAHGLNLQSGGHSVCWFSMTFNLEEFIQFNARVWRQGQPSPHVIVHHIAARGTIDSHVDEVVRAKDARQTALFDALVQHAKGTA
jgi:SNF2 family DNA or RNA helicase